MRSVPGSGTHGTWIERQQADGRSWRPHHSDAATPGRARFRSSGSSSVAFRSPVNPDWDGYRQAMNDEGKSVILIAPTATMDGATALAEREPRLSRDGTRPPIE